MAQPSIDPDGFLAKAVRASELPAISGSGVYGICLTNPGSLPPISAGKNGLLYVGMTEQGLDARNHFTHTNSGFSTFRRSLGAILKTKLALNACPRSAGASRSNVVNYRFSDVGEQALTRWMYDHLSIAQAALTGDVAGKEKELIALMEPPLNLTGWPNPQRALIKRLRAECVDEAQLVGDLHRRQSGFN